MTSFMRKAIAMGVYDPRSVDQNFGFWGGDWQATNTGYVRLWIALDRLAPYGPNQPANDNTPLPGQSTTIAQYVAALDAQIKFARDLGLKVVLTFSFYPSWINGTTNQTPDYRLYPPTDLSINGSWAAYLFEIMYRWSSVNPNNGGAYADFLEVCNEPNLFKPAPISHIPAGRMMRTAQQIQQATGLTTPILCGPGLLDLDAGNAGGTPTLQVVPFANNLLGYLSTNGFDFTSPYFAWSHHNYNDIQNYGGGTPVAQSVRARLRAYGWGGWPRGSSADAYMLLTEGGARFNVFGGSAQGPRMVTAYNNVRNDDPARGEGLAMFTNYLDVTDPNFDTGLRISNNPTYTQRTLYSSWATLPQP